MPLSHRTYKDVISVPLLVHRQEQLVAHWQLPLCPNVSSLNVLLHFYLARLAQLHTCHRTASGSSFPSNMWVPETELRQQVPCRSLSETGPPEAQVFEYLVHHWQSCWLGLGGVTLLKEVCHWGRALRSQSLMPLPVCFLCLLLVA